MKKTLSILLINLVLLALVVVLLKDLNQLNVIIVLEEEKLELTKDFLQFNKHVLSVVVMGRRLVNHVIPVVAMVKFKPMKM